MAIKELKPVNSSSRFQSFPAFDEINTANWPHYCDYSQPYGCPAGQSAYHDPGPISPPSLPPCVDLLLPGYRRAWFGNRDLSGTPLNVRFWNNNFDGLASQQQWVE